MSSSSLRESSHPEKTGTRHPHWMLAISLPLLVVALVFTFRHGRPDVQVSAQEPEGVTASAMSLPSAWVTPLTLDFGPVAVGSTSPQQVVTIKNVGSATLTNFAGGAPFDSQFGATQNCAGGVAPGASCQYFFTFKPTASGTFTTTSNSSTNAGPFVITLRGTGRTGTPPPGAEVSVSPLFLDFGPVAVGTTSPQQIVTIKNTGSSILTNFAGGAPFDSQFGATQNCAGGVAPGASCQYFFTFTPKASGQYTTTSTTSTNAGPFTVTLRGGVAAPQMTKSFSPSTIAPGEQSTLRLEVTNINQAMTLNGVSINDAFPAGLTIASPRRFGASSQCGAPTFSPVAGAESFSFVDGDILGRATCVITVSVTAAAAGSYLNVTAPGSTNGGTGNATAATLEVVAPTATATPTPTGTATASPTPTASATTTATSTVEALQKLYLPLIVRGAEGW